MGNTNKFKDIKDYTMKIIIITERNHESQNKKLSTRNDKYLDLKHEIMEVKVENLANNRILKAEKDAKTADKLDNSEYLKINRRRSFMIVIKI